MQQNAQCIYSNVFQQCVNAYWITSRIGPWDKSRYKVSPDMSLNDLEDLLLWYHVSYKSSKKKGRKNYYFWSNASKTITHFNTPTLCEEQGKISNFNNIIHFIDPCAVTSVVILSLLEVSMVIDKSNFSGPICVTTRIYICAATHCTHAVIESVFVVWFWQNTILCRQITVIYCYLLTGAINC